MGDVTTRRILMNAGLTEAEARAFTLTSEPEFALTRRLADLGKGSPLMQMLLPFSRTAANIVEQGAKRMPGLGFLVQAQREVPDPIKQQVIQQLMATGAGGAAAVGGYYAPDSPISQRFVRGAISNVGGPLALQTGMGYTLGQALKRGDTSRRAAGAGITQGLQTLPLPTTSTLEDLKQLFLAEPGTAQIPSGLYPKTLVDPILEGLRTGPARRRR